MSFSADKSPQQKEAISAFAEAIRAYQEKGLHKAGHPLERCMQLLICYYYINESHKLPSPHKQAILDALLDSFTQKNSRLKDAIIQERKRIQHTHPEAKTQTAIPQGWNVTINSTDPWLDQSFSLFLNSLGHHPNVSFPRLYALVADINDVILASIEKGVIPDHKTTLYKALAQATSRLEAIRPQPYDTLIQERDTFLEEKHEPVTTQELRAELSRVKGEADAYHQHCEALNKQLANAEHITSRYNAICLIKKSKVLHQMCANIERAIHTYLNNENDQKAYKVRGNLKLLAAAQNTAFTLLTPAKKSAPKPDPNNTFKYRAQLIQRLQTHCHAIKAWTEENLSTRSLDISFERFKTAYLCAKDHIHPLYEIINAYLYLPKKGNSQRYMFESTAVNLGELYTNLYKVLPQEQWKTPLEKIHQLAQGILPPPAEQSELDLTTERKEDTPSFSELSVIHSPSVPAITPRSALTVSSSIVGNGDGTPLFYRPSDAQSRFSDDQATTRSTRTPSTATQNTPMPASRERKESEESQDSVGRTLSQTTP